MRTRPHRPTCSTSRTEASCSSLRAKAATHSTRMCCRGSSSSQGSWRYGDPAPIPLPVRRLVPPLAVCRRERRPHVRGGVRAVGRWPVQGTAAARRVLHEATAHDRRAAQAAGDRPSIRQPAAGSRRRDVGNDRSVRQHRGLPHGASRAQPLPGDSPPRRRHHVQLHGRVRPGRHRRVVPQPRVDADAGSRHAVGPC